MPVAIRGKMEMRGGGLVHVFVYGSLRPGGWNQRVLEPFVAQMEPGWLDGMVLYQVDERYPGIVHGAGVVRGELVRVRPERAEAALAALDRLEEYFGPGDPRNEYERELVAVRTESGERVSAWVYRWLGSVECCPVVVGGEIGRAHV